MTIKYRGEHVGTESGQRLFYPIRGLCDDDYHMGRFAGVDEDDDDIKQFVFVSECCQPPLDPENPGEGYCPDDVNVGTYEAHLNTTPFIVECDLSRIMMVQFKTISRCGDVDCLFNYIYYVEPEDAVITTTACGNVLDAEKGYWIGTLKGINIIVWCEDDGYGNDVLRGCIWHSCLPSPGWIDLGQFGSTGEAGCPGAGQSDPLLIGDCCECAVDDTVGTVNLLATAYCAPRWSGRHVGTISGLRAFITNLTCDPYCSSDLGCCQLIGGCPITLEITDNSGCPDFDLSGSYTFTPDPADDSHWTYLFTMGDEAYLWDIDCIEDESGSHFVFNGTFEYDDGDGCSCQIGGESEPTTECRPLDVTFPGTYGCDRVYGEGDCCDDGVLSLRITSSVIDECGA